MRVPMKKSALIVDAVTSIFTTVSSMVTNWEFVTSRITLCLLLTILGTSSLSIWNFASAENLDPGQVFRDCPECPEMVVIPAGTFLMGSSDAELARDLAQIQPEYGIFSLFGFSDRSTFKSRMASEQPQHSVSISKPFGLGRYLVTKNEYSKFEIETGYKGSNHCVLWNNHRFTNASGFNWSNIGVPQTDRDPVACVSWKDAKAYIAWLNGKIRKSSVESVGLYRLPSEAEWEYAARAGTRTARWWGDDIGSLNANCLGCGTWSGILRTSPVDTFHPNRFGLFDMLGNVWEFTEDCRYETYEDAPNDGSARKDEQCGKIVIRGGAWDSNPFVLRSADRGYSKVDDAVNDTGFRVARTLP